MGVSRRTTHGDLEMPEAAPLVFPALDEASDAEKQNTMKRAGKFIADYYDRRARATYVCVNPDNPFRYLLLSTCLSPSIPLADGLSLGRAEPRQHSHCWFKARICTPACRPDASSRVNAPSIIIKSEYGKVLENVLRVHRHRHRQRQYWQPL